jgi:hypothetical protein
MDIETGYDAIADASISIVPAAMKKPLQCVFSGKQRRKHRKRPHRTRIVYAKKLLGGMAVGYGQKEALVSEISSALRY